MRSSRSRWALNPLTAVHIAIFGLSLWSLLLAGRSAVEGAESVTDRLNRRAAGGQFLIGVATMFGLLWLGQIATVATTGSVLPSDLVKADISSNPVYALDLAFFRHCAPSRAPASGAETAPRPTPSRCSCGCP